MRHPVLALGVAATVLAGCTSGPFAVQDTTTSTRGATVPGPAPGRSFALAAFDSCEQFAAFARDEAGKRVTAWGLGGGPVWYDKGRTEATIAPTAEGAGDMANGGADTSGTNVQEPGVDEGDLVETDGRVVYSVVGGRLAVVDTVDGTRLADVELPGGDHQLLLDGDRLAVVTRSWGGEVIPLGGRAADARIAVPGGPFAGAAETVVTLYDVRTPAAPELVARTHLEGDLVASRASDGVARFVLRSGFGARLPFVMPASSAGEERALELNRRVIAESTAADWLPWSYTERPDGTVTDPAPALRCEAVERPVTFAGLGMLWVVEVPFAGDGVATGEAAVVAQGETAYASAQTLYVATTQWQEVLPGQTAPPTPEEPTTAIHAFALGGEAGTRYVASGEVPGTLLNQFSMSEHAGVLRVAVTEGGMGDDSRSSVHVLRRDRDTLVEIGSVGDLGPTERIYAVRFLGDRGYVVTFRQTDPLYVLDLSDPGAPRLTGELKIPGYSAYLHPLAGERLLGVGQDADETGRVKGTQLSLFDVADPADPRQVAVLALGGWTEVEVDHLAFLWWPSAADPATGTAVVPVQVFDGGQFQGVVVAAVTADGLSERGRLEHPGAAEWGGIRRSLVVGGQLVTVSAAGVLVSDLGSLSRVHWVPTT